jgi:hypothetical protein
VSSKFRIIAYGPWVRRTATGLVYRNVMAAKLKAAANVPDHELPIPGAVIVITQQPDGTIHHDGPVLLDMQVGGAAFLRECVDTLRLHKTGRCVIVGEVKDAQPALHFELED